MVVFGDEMALGSIEIAENVIVSDLYRDGFDKVLIIFVSACAEIFCDSGCGAPLRWDLFRWSDGVSCNWRKQCQCSV